MFRIALTLNKILEAIMHTDVVGKMYIKRM